MAEAEAQFATKILKGQGVKRYESFWRIF